MRQYLQGLTASVLAVCVAMASGVRAEEGSLTIGDPAPPIAVAEWVKGGPIEGFEDDKVYVVEFWATWCGPCRTSIPHLTEIQEKYRDRGVEVIGVSISESDFGRVGPFVEEMGEKMDYHVATDQIPEGGSARDGKMSGAWMQAAGEGGIPTAFIVQEGKVVWIGHPMSMDDPLEQVVSGEYDLDAAVAARAQEKARQEAMAELRKKLAPAIQARDTEQALAVLDQAIADDPGVEPMLAFMKLSLLRQAGNNDAFLDYGTRLVDGALKEEASALNTLAWMIVDPRGPQDVPEPAAQLALKAALRANELTGGDQPPILDTLARAHFVAGDLGAAVEHQQKAVDLAGDAADDEMKSRLEEYRKAAEAKD